MAQMNHVDDVLKILSDNGPAHVEAASALTAKIAEPGIFAAFSQAQTERSDKLATDAVGVFNSFMNSEVQLQNVDNITGSKWQQLWRELNSRYITSLRNTNEAGKLALAYFADFKKKVSDQFSVEESQWEHNKALFLEFLKDPRGEQLERLTQESSQGFTDLRRDVQTFKGQFSDFAASKGESLNQQVQQLHRDIENLQAKIAEAQSAAKQVLNALQQIAGVPWYLGWMISKILGALGIADEEQARRVLDQHYREEQELREQKDRVSREADEVSNKNETILQQVQNALAILSQDVVDITSRLDSFADDWSRTNHDIVLLEFKMEAASTSDSRLFFVTRVKLLGNSIEAFISSVSTYVDAIDKSGVLNHK